jgi:hypothetical protein
MAHGYGLTFLGHLFDLIGREGDCEFLGIPYFGGFPESDALFNYLHVLAGTKPLSFYDYDYWRAGFGDPHRERRLRKCLFYGVFPGLPWVNEQEATEGAEALRPLARRYFPAIERLAEAGWEPITAAVASDAAAMVERYGDGRRHNLHFALRNETPQPLTFTLTISLKEAGFPSTVVRLMAVDLLSGTRLDGQLQGRYALMPFTLSPEETLAFALGRSTDLARPHLKRAAEKLGLLRDVASFNTQPAPQHSLDLRPGWYVDRHNGRGSYRVDEDPSALDGRGRPAIRMRSRAKQDCGIYCSGPYDLRVKAGEEYELLLRYQARSPQDGSRELKDFSVVIGFSEYFGRLLEDAWQEMELPSSSPWAWQRVRVTVPGNAYRMFFRFVLKGRDTTVWLADQRLARAEEAEAARAELERMEPGDPWLATQAAPRLAGLTQQIASTAASPTWARVRLLRQQLTALKDEIQQRHPPTDEPGNREAWQRLTDALAQMEAAARLLREN